MRNMILAAEEADVFPRGLNGIESDGALQRQMNESRGEDGLRGQPKVSTAER